MYDENFKERLDEYGPSNSTLKVLETEDGGSRLDVFEALEVATKASPYWRYGPLPNAKTCEAKRLLITYERQEKRQVTVTGVFDSKESGPRWTWGQDPYIAWCPMPSPCEGNSPSEKEPST